MTSKKLWEASPNKKQKTNLATFINFVNKNHQTDFHTNDYQDFHQWSVQHRELFWKALADFCEVNFSQAATNILENGCDIENSQWFVNAELNFAENLLKAAFHETEKKQLAIIEYNEDGKNQQLSYEELLSLVASLAAFLQQQGLKTGDRVAACMPNCSEALIGMLACSSIGAIWSSCSPDFGVKGMLDRFEQIEPKVLLGCLNYKYKGKVIDVKNNLQQLAASLPSLNTLIYLDDKFKNETPAIRAEKRLSVFSFKQASATPSGKFSFTQLPFNHPLYIMFSSGTTGVPKCIVHGAGGTLLQHLKEQQLHCDLQAGDRIFYFTTCGWMMWNWLVGALASKATLILYDGSPFHPNPDILFEIAENESIIVMGLGAPYLAAIEKEGIKPAQTCKLDKLKTILSTGSPLAAESFDYVYREINSDICLSSISGGTDIISCFVLGNPLLPVYQGEIQCAGLGMDVAVYDEQGNGLSQQKGELVCRQSFPSMPIGFWNDTDGNKFHSAYFDRFENHWAHGDFAEITEHDGFIIHGRSDAVLNPGGVRIGTAEIYRQVNKVDEVLESIVVGQTWQGDIRVVLFVKLKETLRLDKALVEKIKQAIRSNTTPRHVPKLVLQVDDIPKTKSGKIIELAVRDIINGGEVKNIEALANPEALEHFRNRHELYQ